MSIKELTSANFDEIVASHPLVLIDFWATWCGPCKSFSAVLNEVVQEYPDWLFASIDVEKEKTLAEEFAVRSVPFVMIIRNQVVVYAESGALTQNSLCELLNQAKDLDEKQLAALTKR